MEGNNKPQETDQFQNYLAENENFLVQLNTNETTVPFTDT